MSLPQLAAAPTAPVYSTDFEDVTMRDANHLNMGIDNSFEFGGAGGATMWLEGLDRKTPGVNCHSGSRCVGMELTDITKSRRNEFEILNLQNLGITNEYFVSVWLYLPADWRLHSPVENWYEIVNPYFSGPPTYLPYSAITIGQETTAQVFDLRTDYRDLSGAMHTWDTYTNFSLPRGRWFQVQYYVRRSSTDGILRIWFDGALVTNRSGLLTKGPNEDWFTTPAKIYYGTNDTFSPYQIWVDDLQIYKAEFTTSVTLSARLDTSSGPTTVMISGSIYPEPGGPVNVTLEFSRNQGGTFQEMTHVTSAPDGTFSYSWKPPGNDVFMIRAETQGVRSSVVSVGMSGVPGFPLESLLVGCAVGLLFAIMRRRQRSSTRVLPDHCLLVPG
jgi:hypothetical protein